MTDTPFTGELYIGLELRLDKARADWYPDDVDEHAMTVADLIAELEEEDPTTRVFIGSGERYSALTDSDIRRILYDRHGHVELIGEIEEVAWYD